MPLPDAMAFRFLFLGPLGFSVVTFVSGFLGWNKYLIIWAAVCVGQSAIGVLSLSVYLEIGALHIVALVLMAGFAVLLVTAFIPSRFLHLPASWRSQ